MDDKKIIIKKLPKSQVQFNLVLDDEVLAKWKDLALHKMASETNIDGFRPGKTPASLIESNYSKEHVKAMIIDTALPQEYSAVITKEKLQVLAQPNVKEIKKDPITFEVTVDVMPEAIVGDYKKLSVPKKKPEVKKKDVDEVISQIKQRNAKYVIVDRALKMEDRAEINFRGYMEKGVYLDKLASKHHPVILGSNSLIPGFEEKLVGMKKGDKKEFEITFPKDYHAKEMKGKKVTFEVDIVEVESVDMPEINEEFIKKITGKDQSVKEFNEDINKNLLERIENEMKAERENLLMDKLVKITKLDAPEALLKEEVGYLLDNLKQRIISQQLTWEDYLKHTKKTEEDIQKEFEPEALKRIILRFAIQEIIKKEKIEVPDSEVQDKIKSITSNMPKKELYKIKKMYKKGQSGYNQLENRLAVDKCIDLLLAQ